MKHFVTLTLYFLFLASTNATNYYLSNSGNDANTGTSSVNPWKTINKLNTVTYAAGDTVFFKATNVFRGKIIVNQGGNSSKQLVFTSYGSGSMPEISGAEPISSWSATAGYYQASFNQSVTHFFVNNREQILARYPNNHSYLSLDEASTTYLKDAALTTLSSSFITGAKVCIHTAQWCWEKTAVSSFLNNQITYSASTQISALANFGYFLYDNIAHLDTANEWKYDNASQKIYYMPASGENPNSLNCEASVYTNGIELGSSASYITISNIAFEKQSNSGIEISSSNNKYIKVDHCYFARQYNYGVHDKGKYNEVSNSYFREVDGIAAAVDGSGGYATIHHNTFRNIGQFRNSGIGTQINLTAIMCIWTNYNYIHHNDIDSAGYCGISADGSYNVIERNSIKNAMLINNDGAALKSYGANSHHNTFRNNFISSSDGNTEGTYNGDFITPAIYFDFYVNNCIIENNTIYSRSKKGIFLNSGTSSNTVSENVVYGGNYCLDLNGGPQTSTPITGVIIKHNSFFVLDKNAYIIRQVDYSNSFNQGTLDSNYYFQPYNANKYAYRIIGSTPTAYSFSNWQATGNDTHTKSSFVSWGTTTNNSQLFMNPTDKDSTITLGSMQYLDLDSNAVCGSITLEPYTSKILITTTTSCASAGVSISQTSGNNPSCSGTSITYTATPTNGGSNPSYQWQVNGSNVGSNSSTFTTSSLSNGQVVSCIMTSSLNGIINNPATSNTISMSIISSVTPSISIALTSGSNPTCSASSVTFTATSTNGGSNPSYQWQVNGSNVGSNSSTFTTSSLSNGQVVSCILTSAESCLSTSNVTSNSITVSVSSSLTPSIAIAITSGSNPTNKGASVTFAASTTNGGTNPTYQWKVNGNNVGTNSDTYTTNSLNNGQSIRCVLISNLTCANPKKVSSNTIKMSVIPLKNELSSISNIEKDNFLNIYPNPCDGYFNIKFSIDNKTSFELEVRNLLGQLIYQESIPDFIGTYSKQMNILNYGKGIYIVSLRENNHIIAKNIIVH